MLHDATLLVLRERHGWQGSLPEDSEGGSKALTLNGKPALGGFDPGPHEPGGLCSRLPGELSPRFLPSPAGPVPPHFQDDALKGLVDASKPVLAVQHRPPSIPSLLLPSANDGAL
eukprot:8447307-Alexandrium_andersonii.AAC.1